MKKPSKRRRVNLKHIKFVRELAKGKSRAEALEAAGIKSVDPQQRSSRILSNLQERMPSVLDKYGLTCDSLVKDLLLPLCYATETKFFPYRVEQVVKPAYVEKGVLIPAVTKTVQKIEVREVVSWRPRRDGLDMALRLGGYYPSPGEEDPNRMIGVKVVLVGVPRPGQPMPRVIEAETNGHKPNGKE